MISRIEQGRADVSLQNLISLSAALGVDVNYFASYQEASSQTEQQLREMLDRVDMSPEVVPALASLSYEAQAALVDALRWLTVANGASPVREQELVDQILGQGVANSIGQILSGIPKFGLDVETFCRVLTQMEELPGDRMVLSDRLLSVTTPNGGQINPLDIFRSIFASQPNSPMLVHRWAQTLQSAVTQSVERFESRTVYPLSAIRRYIDSGYWGIGVEVESNLVHQHVSDLVRALRTLPNFHVGLIDDDIPFGLLVKGGKQAMVHVRRDPGSFIEQEPGIAFRATRPDLVWKFREYFEEIWEQIPEERKDSDAVATWFEEMVATTAN